MWLCTRFGHLAFLIKVFNFDKRPPHHWKMYAKVGLRACLLCVYLDLTFLMRVSLECQVMVTT